MTNTKHTPGPWSVLQKDAAPFGSYWYVLDKNGGIVAENYDDSPANAKLLAAAPELLAALQTIADTDDRDRPAIMRTVARYAIVKATA